MEAPSFEDTVAIEEVPSFESTSPVDEAPSFEDTQPLEEAPTPERPVGELSSRFVSSMAEATINTATGAARLIAETPFGKVANFVAEKTGGTTSGEFITELEGAGERAKDEYGVDPKFDKGLPSALASGGGQLVSMLASGPAAPFVGALQAGEQGYQEAEAAGATGVKLLAATAGNAATAFVSEKLLGVPAMLKSLKGAAKVPMEGLKGAIKSILGQAGKGFVREGVQETVEEVVQDFIAKGLYDPKREMFTKEYAGKLATVGLAGGILGGGLTGGLRAIDVASPKTIAPKTEMQDVAQSVDESLAEMAVATPPSPETTPVISQEEISMVPEGTPEELQSAVQPTEAEPEPSKAEMPSDFRDVSNVLFAKKRKAMEKLDLAKELGDKGLIQGAEAELRVVEDELIERLGSDSEFQVGQKTEGRLSKGTHVWVPGKGLERVKTQGESPSSFVGTAINAPGGPVTGDEIGSAHLSMIDMALSKGSSVEKKDLGFAFRKPDGTIEWVNRVEAGERLTKSGHITGLKPGEELTSEHIRNEVKGVTFNPNPTKPNVQQTEETQGQAAPEVRLTQEQAAKELQPLFRQAEKTLQAKEPGAAANQALESLSREVAEGKPIELAKQQFMAAARNFAANQKRGLRAKMEVQPTPSEEGTTAIEQATTDTGPRRETVSQEDVTSIEGKIDSLPEPQKVVMKAMVENPGLTDQEISEQTGQTLDQVKKNKSKARQALAEFIRSQGIGEKMAPGASNIRELRNARYALASDIYEGLRQTKQLDRQTWEKNILREYGDIFDQQQLDDAWAISQEASRQFQEAKGRKPMGKIIDQLTGAKPGEGVTSIKNEQADAERRARGLPAAMNAARRAQVGLWDEAMRYMEENPRAQTELISRLNQDTRSVVNDRDLMILTHAKIEAENQYEEALKDVNEAATEQSRLEAMQRAKEVEAKLINIYDIAKQVGSEQGRAFAARKMLISRDFSVGRLTSEIQAAQGGQELSEEQTKTVQEISQKVQETESKLDERTSELEQEQSTKAFNEAVKDFQERLPFDQRILAIANRIVAKLDQAAKAARERIRKRLQNTNALVDPTLIYDLAVIGASKIAHGLRDLAWKNSMREEFGEDINPHLDQVYKEADAMIDRLEDELPNEVRTKVRTVVRKEGSQDVLKDTQAKITARMEAGESLNDLRAMIQKMALALVRSGVTDPTKLLDTMHAIVEPLQKGITRREVMDLVSGYGDFKALDMEKAKVTLRDLKGQMQNLAKLEDIQSKQKVEKTGIERRKPSDTERRLIAEVNEAKKKFGVGTLEAYKTRLQHSISDLQDRINRRDFRKKTPQPLDVSRDPEAVRLAAENARWKKKFEIEKLRAQRAMETKFEKASRIGKEALNIPRALLSSMDFSAVLRQGGFVALGNPLRAARNLPQMFGSAISESLFEKSEAQIRSRPNSDLYKRSKLYLADIDGKIDSKEEAFRAELADRIPIVGKLVRGSNRAYVAFLNRLRADSFDAMTSTLVDPTPEQLKAIAHYINVATGRGDLGVHGSAAETLSTVLWSPRLLISRIQLLAAEPLARGDAKGVRTVIAKEYGKALIGGATVVALGLLAGADIEDDPRSSDFGKLRFGDTRVDPWMGLQQITTLASRLFTQETKTKSGQIMSLRKKEGDTSRPPWAETGFDVSARFLRTKLTPVLGEFFNQVSGETVVGEKVTPAGTAKRLLTPLSFQDIYDVMLEQGVARGTALTILNLFGMSVQHQEKR